MLAAPTTHFVKRMQTVLFRGAGIEAAWPQFAARWDRWHEENRVDREWLMALSGVLGSLVGGSVTVATTWVTQKTLSKRELLREEMRIREALYSEFLGECAKRLVDAFARHLESPETMLHVYELINRIRLSASRPVLVEAEQLLQRITDQYFSSSLTVDEVRQLMHSENADPLKEFGEACRAELKGMRGSL